MLTYYAYIKVSQTNQPESMTYFSHDVKDLHKSELDKDKHHIYMGRFRDLEHMVYEYNRRTIVLPDGSLKWSPIRR